MMNDNWPFDQPKNCAVVTLRRIVFDGAPILHVTHDSADHGWQFLSLTDAPMEEGCVLCFEEIVHLDESVLELADLPPGWHAWRRSPSAPWIREPNPYDNG